MIVRLRIDNFSLRKYPLNPQLHLAAAEGCACWLLLSHSDWLRNGPIIVCDPCYQPHSQNLTTTVANRVVFTMATSLLIARLLIFHSLSGLPIISAVIMGAFEVRLSALLLPRNTRMYSSVNQYILGRIGDAAYRRHDKPLCFLRIIECESETMSCLD